MSNQLYPDVIDASSLGAKFSSDVFMAIGIEGLAGNDGTGTVGVEYLINRPSDATLYFGQTSVLTQLVQYVLGRGVAPVYAVASAKGAGPPTLAQRQAAWQVLETDPNVRIRLTGATDQATLAALASSCDNANLLQNKQVAFGGLATGLTKAQYIAAAEALNHRRFVLVCPGIIDGAGVLQTGSYAAATVAAAVSQNNDIADDQNLDLLPNTSGIELNALNQPLFLERVVSGVVVNDFEDVLQAGGSPLMSDRAGLGVRITHLRMTYTGGTPETDYTYDSLMTRLIVDQVFLDVKAYCYNNAFLKRGNTQDTRDLLSAGVTALLDVRGDWILPVTQADGTLGYGVTVVPTSNMRSVIIQYQGIVVRGISTIQVDAELTIPV